MVDVPGSVTIVDVATQAVSTAAFAPSDVVPGVRVNLPTADVDELEPEYIAVSADSATAYVTLQENNAIAVVDIATADVTSVAPLGAKSHSVAGQGLDPSDRDGAVDRDRQPAGVRPPHAGWHRPALAGRDHLPAHGQRGRRPRVPAVLSPGRRAPELPLARRDRLHGRGDTQGRRCLGHGTAAGIPHRR